MATKGRIAGSLALLAGVALMAGPAEARKCKQDAVQVGNVCVDKYEASAWETTDAATIKDIKKGKIQSAADLSAATQRGAASDDYGAACPDTGNGCTTIYAVSVAGATPARYITWFQAAAACRNAGKRLATNQEWQMAALGTPDPGTDNGTGDCNINSSTWVLPEDPVNTGSRSLCVSDVGAFDMVGNLWEWVADLVDYGDTGCEFWSPTYGSDISCLGGSGVSFHLPGAVIRGGGFLSLTSAGVFAAMANHPVDLDVEVGFRCAREL